MKNQKSKYTPGPWTFTGESKGYFGSVEGDGFKYIINEPSEGEKRRANAKLITAAPVTIQQFQKLVGVVESIIEDHASYIAADESGANEAERKQRKHFFEHELSKHMTKLREVYDESLEAIKAATE